MERIDVLKGIEQILVQKAYETGHISHRTDGDWQKQADGSWIPYKGQSNQPAPQTQEPTENTEYGEITEEDLKPSYSDDEESSGSGVYGDIENYDFADLDDYNSMISSAFNAESGIFDDDDELTDIATQYAQDHDIEDTDNNINWIRNKIMGHAERLFADDYGSDNESVGKSAIRDMRSAPTTKNMGF